MLFYISLLIGMALGEVYNGVNTTNGVPNWSYSDNQGLAIAKFDPNKGQLSLKMQRWDGKTMRDLRESDLQDVIYPFSLDNGETWTPPPDSFYRSARNRRAAFTHFLTHAELRNIVPLANQSTEPIAVTMTKVTFDDYVEYIERSELQCDQTLCERCRAKFNDDRNCANDWSCRLDFAKCWMKLPWREDEPVTSFTPVKACDNVFRRTVESVCAADKRDRDYCLQTSMSDALVARCDYAYKDSALADRNYERQHPYDATVENLCKKLAYQQERDPIKSAQLNPFKPIDCGNGFTCGDCADGGSHCLTKCEPREGRHLLNYKQTLDKRSIDVSCRCGNPKNRVIPVRVDATTGYVQFTWPHIFSCKHHLSITLDGVEAVSRTFLHNDCSGEASEEAFLSSFKVNNEPAGKVMKYSFHAVVDTGAKFVTQPDSRVIPVDYYVPFTASVTAKVETDEQQPIRDRRVLFVVKQTLALRRALGNAASRPRLSINGGPQYNNVTRLTGHTGANGTVTLNIQYDTQKLAIDRAEAIALLQTVEVNVYPHMTPYGVSTKYSLGCDACTPTRFNPCNLCQALTNATQNDHQHTVTFVDSSVVRVYGKVPFLRHDTCFVDDLKVEAFNDAGDSVADSTTTGDGSFSLALQRQVPVKLVFTRLKSPDYYYVTETGSATTVAEIEVPGINVDFEVPVPFRVATRRNDDGKYALVPIQFPMHAGLCEYELGSMVDLSLEVRSPACNNNVKFDLEAKPFAGVVLLESVPPLDFAIESFVITGDDEAAAANVYFQTNYAAQRLDARLPQLAREDGMMQPTSVAEANAHLESHLRDSLVLALPFDESSRDLTHYRHPSALTGENALAYTDKEEPLGRSALVLKTNASALAFGRNSALDLRGSTYSVAFWLSVSRVNGTTATLLRVGSADETSFAIVLTQLASRRSVFSLELHLNDQTHKLPSLDTERRMHVALVVQSVDAAQNEAQLYIDGKSQLNTLLKFKATRSFRQCAQNAARQSECVRHFLLGADAPDARMTVDGTLDDFLVWKRALRPVDIAFLRAAGRDGLGIDELLGEDGGKLPAYVYRAQPVIEFPDDDVRYFRPPRRPPAEGEVPPPKTLAELLAGTPLEAKKCRVRHATEPAATSELVLRNVTAGGMVSIMTHIYEPYNQGRCYRVGGLAQLRSTFTSTCQQAESDASNDDILPCSSLMEPTSFGYFSFLGVVNAAKLIPLNADGSSGGDGSSSRAFDEFTLDEQKPFLGEFRFRFTDGVSIEKSLYFHVNGYGGPDFPTAYTLPISDVPLLRLYKPPGDQSQSFLERNWAESVQLGFGSSSSDTINFQRSTEAKTTVGLDVTSCAEVGVSIGFGASVTASTASCTHTNVDAFLQASLEAGNEWSESEGYSLSEAFDTQTLLKWETAINNGAVGKWGDIVVTTGMIILVTDSYHTKWLATEPDEQGVYECVIDQIYAPEWKPDPKGVADSLHITPRLAVKPQIDSWKRLRAVINRDCGGKLDETLGKTPLPSAFDDCKTALGAPMDARTLNETINKFKQAGDGAARWSAILQNWEAVLCKAMRKAGAIDYYADPDNGVPTCRTAGYDGVEIPDPTLWSLLGENNNAEFEARRDAAGEIVDEMAKNADQHGFFEQYCKRAKADDFGPLSQHAESLGRNCDTMTARAGYQPIERRDGIHKLTMTSPGGFSYATSATVTHSESYAVDSSAQWHIQSSVGGGVDTKITVPFIGPKVQLEWEVNVGVGGGATHSMSSSGQRVSSDTTTVGFTLADDDALDTVTMNVFADPVYGTPIFVLVSGYTMCPHEPGTVPRQGIEISPLAATPDTAVAIYEPEPNGEIELDISAFLATKRPQDDGTAWHYQLRARGLSDLKLTQNGLNVGVGSGPRIELLNTGVTKIENIRVRRGKGFSYEGLHVFIVSECDDGVATQKALAEGVYYDLQWQPECATTELNTTYDASEANTVFPSERDFFIVNGATSNKAVVRIKNPNPVNAPWPLIGKDFTIQLQYRSAGEQSNWQELPGASRAQPVYCQNGAKAGAAPSCFAQCKDPDEPQCCRGFAQTCSNDKACCDNVGLVCNGETGAAGVCVFAHDERHAEITFDADALTVQEGAYELRSVAFCPGGKSTTGATVVKGRIDRVAPRLFGAFQQPADQLWWPGDTIALRFTEELNCERPLRFSTSVLVDGNSVPTSAAVDVICKEEQIEYAFSRDFITSDTPLKGKRVTFRTTGVLDLAENAATSAEWSFSVGNFDESETSVKLSDVRVPASVLAGVSPVDELRELLGVDEQVQVAESGAARKRQRDADVYAFDIDIKPASAVRDGQGAIDVAKRLLTAENDVDYSNARVTMQAPGRPSNQLAASDTAALPWYAILGIVAGALVYVGVIALLVICLLKKRGGESSEATPYATQLVVPVPTNEPPPTAYTVKRSSRRKKSSRRVTTADGQRIPAPIAVDVVPTTTSSRRKVSSRRKSRSRRTAAGYVAVPAVLQEQVPNNGFAL